MTNHIAKSACHFAIGQLTAGIQMRRGDFISMAVCNGPRYDQPATAARLSLKIASCCCKNNLLCLIFRSPWLSYAPYFPAPWGNVKCYLDLSFQVAHTANTLTLGFQATINDVTSDESFAFSGLSVNLVPCA